MQSCLVIPARQTTLLPGPAGLGLRMPITFLVMYGSGFSIKEKLFFALSWSPKVRPAKYLCNEVAHLHLHQPLLNPRAS